MNLIFLGPPGVGKGTIAKYIVKEKGIPQISTGDLLRAAVKEGSELGKKARGYMGSGGLVPDNLVIGLLKDRITKDDSQNGFILDGFPRTIPQAKALEESNVQIDKVLNFKASDELVIDRISGRRTCKKCNAIYHIRNIPPKVEDVCDKCGGELFQRGDDKQEKVKKRLEVYREQTAPLIDYYKEKGILADIETEQPIPGIVVDVMEEI
ncbi:adenylate kinase [Candidatus Pacearchaeota archaeon]|nr:adenylate kinase [Candidatus Pacearchaeota archaeon]